MVFSSVRESFPDVDFERSESGHPLFSFVEHPLSPPLTNRVSFGRLNGLAVAEDPGRKIRC